MKLSAACFSPPGLAAAQTGAAQTAAWKDRPVIDTSRSPHARLHGVPVGAVKVGDGFWTARRKVNEEVSLPTMFELLEQNGILDNFRRAAGTKRRARRGPGLHRLRHLQVARSAGVRLQSDDNPQLRALGEGAIARYRRGAGARRLSSIPLYVKENAAKRHTAHGGQPRTLLPGPHAAGGHGMEPRHGRNQTAGFRFDDGGLSAARFRSRQEAASSRATRKSRCR